MSLDRRGVADRVHSACIHLLRMVRSVDRETGLSPSRLSALSVLVFGGARTIGELAAAEGVRSPTMTQLVNGLEADGLVRRRPAPADARSVVVEATASGRRTMRQAQRRRLDVLVDLLGPVDPVDLELLDRATVLLERLARGG